MSLVVCKVRPSISAAYKAFEKQIGVSRVAFYSKINGIEPQVSQALVRYSSEQLAPIIAEMGGKQPEILPGYRIKIIDGNSLAATEHRLSVLREVASPPLPGKSLVVIDPVLMLAIDQFSIEDAYTQERAIFKQVVETCCTGDVWVADRNFCTCGFLVGTAEKSGYFIIRQHASMPYKVLSELKEVCEINTLGYPKAALFSFCTALVAYNILSVIKAALRCVHGQGKIDAGISNYYLVEEIQSTYTGMMIAIPVQEWEFISSLNLSAFSELLKQWAAQVDLKRFASSPRDVKKPRPPREQKPNRPHVSTARLLAEKQRNNKASTHEKLLSDAIETPATHTLQS